MAPEGASLSHKKRGGREIITLRVPQHETLLKGLDLDPDILPVARRACKNLWHWRNEFDVERRRKGEYVPSATRINRTQAERLLSIGLALLASASGGE